MSYQVKLEVFEGPFDLLLHLIAKRKVEVTEVDLAEITADFLASLEGLEELDLETATRFLVVAATLVELKAARLLPAEQQDELDDLLGEARDLLYARLLEYRAFRLLAEQFRDRVERNAPYVGRSAPLDPDLRRLVPDSPLPIDVAGLAGLAAAALAPKPERHVDLSHIRRAYLSIREAARQILDSLPRTGDSAAFRALAEGRSRSDRVVMFLSALELYKLGHLDLAQAAFDAPLEITRRESVRSLEALTEADQPEAGESSSHETPTDDEG